MRVDEKVGNGVPNGSLYGTQISKIDLLKAQVSRDSIETQGKWKPFKDIRFFIFIFSGVAISILAAQTHFTAAMRTIERRFGLSSTQTGLIASMNDIINICLVLFLGYLGRKLNKPRILSVLTFLGGVGVIINTIPHFALPAENNSRTNQTQQDLLTCPAASLSQCTTASSAQNANEEKAYILLLIGAAVSGLANSGLAILSMSYIDENTPKVLSPFYIGVASAAYPLGPVLSFGLAAGFLRLPENLKDSPVPSSDPSFIGCWWMPFLIYGCLLIVFAIPLIFFPKHMRHYNKVKFETIQSVVSEKGFDAKENVVKSKSAKERFKDVLGSFWRVLSNGPYVVLVVSSTCALFMLISLFLQMTKYLQIQFQVSPTKASLTVGGCGAFTQVAGSFLAGFVLKKFKIKLKGASRIYLLCFVVMVVAIGFLFPWKCTHPQLPPNRENNYVTSCNQDCSCSLETTNHVCGDDHVLFPSPCHAGCDTGFQNRTFGGCECSSSTVPLKTGFCQMDECSKYIYYIIIFALMNFSAAFARLAAQILQLRLVDEDLKPVALGSASFLYNALVFIPGPIIMGRVFDSTCLLWRKTCGKEGNCLVYDMDKFRFYMHGVSIGAVGIGGLFGLLLVLLVARRVNREDAAERAKERAGFTGFTNDAVIGTHDNEDAASLRSYNTKF